MAGIHSRKLWILCISARKFAPSEKLNPLSTAVFPFFHVCLSASVPSFYLTDQVQTVGEIELAQIIVRNQPFLSRARPIEAEKRSLPGTDPTATLVVGTLRQLLELSRSRYPRTREKCRTTLRYLRTGNTELAKRPFVPVPISIDGYIATR